MAQVGQRVEVDDVVALVETDKVTVEIKADVSGVVTAHHGRVYVLRWRCVCIACCAPRALRIVSFAYCSVAS